jgi:hypothetical protein
MPLTWRAARQRDAPRQALRVMRRPAWAALLLTASLLSGVVQAMTRGQIAALRCVSNLLLKSCILQHHAKHLLCRQEAVELFYHGYTNYMEVAFPEDEASLPYLRLPTRNPI